MVVSRFHKTDTHRGQKKKEVSRVFLILWFETRRFWPLSFLFLNYARKKKLGKIYSVRLFKYDAGVYPRNLQMAGNMNQK